VIVAAIAIGWALCVLSAYTTFRNADQRWRLKRWTLSDRVGCGGVCLLLGPVAALIALTRHRIDWDKEVKW